MSSVLVSYFDEQDNGDAPSAAEEKSSAPPEPFSPTEQPSPSAADDKPVVRPWCSLSC